MLECGIIESANSFNDSPIVLVKKKDSTIDKYRIPKKSPTLQN
jgi:hypothetical protein